MPGSDTASQSGADSARQGASNTPGQDAGTAARFPAEGSDAAGGRDSATGGANGTSSGAAGASTGPLGQPGGDYSLDTLPSGTLGGGGDQRGGQRGDQQGNQGGDQPTGAITAAERAAILDGRLRRGYEDFDGFILGERERAQRESNQAGSVQIGAEAGGTGGSVAANQPQTLPSDNGAPPAGVVAASQPVQQGSAPAETFPPPEDIPSGRDDDVVARQIREAAMTEPDPELREALWDEYRRYTGIAGGEEQ